MSQTNRTNRTNQLGVHATNTFVENGKTKVVYHSTPIAVFDHVSIALDTGGWMSASTKMRMNQASKQFDLGFAVFQKDFKWFVQYDGATIPFKDNTVKFKRHYAAKGTRTRQPAKSTASSDNGQTAQR